MILDEDQDIQQHFSDLLDGKITEDTLTAFGGAELVPDDGFQSFAIISDERHQIYRYWEIEYRSIKLQFKFVTVHKDEETETYILLNERKVYSMRQLFEMADKYIPKV